MDASHPRQIERFRALRPTLTGALERVGVLMGLLIPPDPVLAEKSGHFVHHDQPALVIQAIKEVVSAPTR